MSLKLELEDTGSALRAFLHARLPDTRAVVADWRSATAGAEPAPVRSAIQRSLLGQAFGIQFAGLVDAVVPEVVVQGARRAAIAGWVDESVPDAVEARLRAVLGSAGREASALSIVAALLEQPLRIGLNPNHPYAALPPGRTLDDLLHEVDEAWVDDLQALCAVNVPVIDDLRTRRPCVVGPTFAGSDLVGGADADLICGGLLVELKVSTQSLAKRDVLQLTSYLLLDLDNRYAIDEVSIVSGLLGRLIAWPVPAFLETLAGAPCDLAEVRQAMSAALRR